MNRRRFLSATAGLACLLAAGAGFAETPVDKVIRQLRNQGFAEIASTRTLLGRARVVAERGEYRREIILNPGSGEILRDIWLDDNGNAVARVLIGDDRDDPDDDSDDDADDSDDKDSDSGSDDSDSDDSDSDDNDSDNSGKGSDSSGGDDD